MASDTEPPRTRTPGPGGASSGDRARARRTRKRSPRRRPVLRAVLAVVVLVAAWVAWSLGSALTAPGTDSAAVRTAEWARDHHLGILVGTLEKVQYDLSPPRVSGSPSRADLRRLTPSATPATPAPPAHHARTSSVVRLHGRLVPQAPHALPGEGRFRPVVWWKGSPVLQVAYLRPDAVHTSYLDGVVWMDHRAARWELHPGYEDPGRLSQWSQPDWVAPNRRSHLLATFNSGFKTAESRGGFYENGHTAGSLLPGAASVVIHRGGGATLGAWGREVSMAPDVVAVRQNLRLLIDHGRIQPHLDTDVESGWGLTIGGGAAVWRSGLGVDRNGDFVVVMGPVLTVRALASLLHDAGAVRAMQLDINPAWMSFMWYTHGSSPHAPVPHKLLHFERPANRYFTPTDRDFFAVHLR